MNDLRSALQCRHLIPEPAMHAWGALHERAPARPRSLPCAEAADVAAPSPQRFLAATASYRVALQELAHTTEIRRTHVEDRLLAEDAVALSAMPTPGVGRLNLHGTRVARAFVAEARLASWVSEQNRSAGLPVRSSAACSRFEELLSESAPAPEHPQLNAEAEQPPHLAGAEYNARRRTASQHWERNFVRRWRFRCGFVRYRSMRPRDPLSHEEKQEKATRKCVSVYSNFLKKNI